MKNIIVGTAGHIDHGKTSLVKALTGTDTDRLKEEKQRGITIDIGFANLTLNGFQLGFVDVPGHERFVKNMLAGAHGIDLVMLVIAADESVMPQTREHLEICQLLRIPTGLVVLTKIDMVDAEWLELVQSEVETFVDGTFLEGKPVIAVSTRTGDGIDELKQALAQIALTVTEKSSARPPRLPIDRVFSVKGFGTVVTGTLIAGSFRVGDDVEIHPGGRRTKIRSIEVHGQSSERATAGQRTAINLQGVDIETVTRGQVVTPAGRFAATPMIDVQLELLASVEKPLRHRTRVRFHHGTSEVMARVHLLNPPADLASKNRELGPGQRCFAQLHLEEPVLALPGDRFILRHYSPQFTIGGGLVLDVQPQRHRASEREGVTLFLAKLSSSDSAVRVAAFLEKSGPSGVTLAELAARSGESDAVLKAVLKRLHQQNQLVFIDTANGKALGQQELTRPFRANWKADLEPLKAGLLKRVGDFHRQKPLQPGASREEMREQVFSRIPVEVFKFTVDTLVAEKKLIADGEVLRLASYQIRVSGAEAQIKEQMERTLRETGLQGLSMAELFEKLKFKDAQARPVYFLLLNEKRLVRVGEFTCHAEIIQNLIAEVRASKAHSPTLDIAFFKDRFGLSRKYAIPLLEYLDSERITRRVGNVREIL
ncbi:MAG TPA: selenocysteine-specific translation elongation factor [Acidobacteriota bacterium]|nr:selenocysteine-specific translation elongation factor [Acidobacteriota bacterium]HND17982.1 selenocysteine-specific translation elongation factor [Acidobacteriota bacterium]